MEDEVGSEIEYKFMGIAVSSNSSLAVDESKEVKKARSSHRRRTTRAVAIKRLVSGVFKFGPFCCKLPSTLDDQESDYVVEYSRHIPYAPRKVTESMTQLVPYQRRSVAEVRSQHLPHVQLKVPERPSNQLQRKVIIYPPSSVSAQRSVSTDSDQWRIGFENTSRWESPLQGWSLTGEPYLGIREPDSHFDSREAAIAYAQKYGWSCRSLEIEDETKTADHVTAHHYWNWQVQGELDQRHQRNSPMVSTYGWVELMRPAVRG